MAKRRAGPRRAGSRYGHPVETAPGCANAAERRAARARVMRVARDVCRARRVTAVRPRVVEEAAPPAQRPGLRGQFRPPATVRLFLSKLCQEDSYEGTFAHEVAHAITKRIRRARGEPSHGPTWRAVMRQMGRTVEERYEDDEYDQKKLHTRLVSLTAAVKAALAKARSNKTAASRYRGSALESGAADAPAATRTKVERIEGVAGSAARRRGEKINQERAQRR